MEWRAARKGAEQEQGQVQETQPEAGVLTVSDAEDGVFYAADVYNYSEAVSAADFNGIISGAELAGVGLGTADNGTLEIDLQTPDGEDFTSDGDFLVVLTNANDSSAPLKYKAAVTFANGSAALKYSTMKTAAVEPSDPSVTVYTVTFDLNYTDAPNPPRNQKINAGGKITRPSPAPTREDYTLDGWYTSKDCTMKWDFDTHTVTADLNLYAKWLDDSITYRTVTFHTNGGIPADFTQTAEDGDKVTLPDPAPTRDGHTFGGWFTDAAGTTKWDFDLNTVTTDIDLYAKWTRNTYKVTFNTGDAEHTPAPLENVLYDDRIAAPAITKTGYTLDGWYISTAYTTKWDFALNTVKESMTLYGTWVPNTYAVTFDLNYTGAPTPPVSPPIAHGGKITRPDPAPTREGYTLGGWYRNADGTGAAWNFDTDTVTEDIALYAKWTVWLESKLSVWHLTDGSAVSISIEEITESEYTSYTDETHYTYKKSYQIGTTIYEIEMSRNGESAHEVDIRRETNGGVTTSVTDYVYDADSGLLKQETKTTTPTSSSGVTGTPSVAYEYFYTVTLQNTAADGTKTYKYYNTSTGYYSIYTIKDGVTLSQLYYRPDGSLVNTRTYTFPDNPVIRERLPALTLCDYTRADTPSNNDYQTCELLASTDTSLTVRIKTFYTSTNVLNDQRDYIYTKITLP